MAQRYLLICATFICVIWNGLAFAQPQNAALTVATVTRAPFSMPNANGGHIGFSIDLLNAAAEELGLRINYVRYDSFAAMLTAVEDGSADAAIANISITAERERLMDFTQPIFDGGVQVMLQMSPGGVASILNVLLTRSIGLLVMAALVLLFGAGMLMWLFERRHQPYFDRDAKDAIFPSFWWALNLVVNGGFEERVPQSRPGRVFGVVLVISSLFIVSIFVAQITAALTVNAIHDNVDNIGDLEGRSIGSIEGSTTSAFLNDRGISHRNFPDPEILLAAFETGDIEAVVFDGPILAHYVRTKGAGKARLLDRVYRPEKYGLTFQNESVFRESFDQAILRLREDGTYSELLTKWFGGAYATR